MANIQDQDVKKFVWRNIVTRFGVPYALISDNGPQFNSKTFRRYCSELGIKNNYSTPAYPQGNGKAKATNKVILDGLKKRLCEVKEKWVNKLPHVLWSYRTTPRRSIGETPFSIMFRVEVVIPVEIEFLMMRTYQFEKHNNDSQLCASLD